MAIAKEMNDAGDYFPLFGTCLGFELFIILESGRGYPENRIRCYSYDNLPLTFTEGNFVCFYILIYSISSGELLYFLFFLFHFNTYFNIGVTFGRVPLFFLPNLFPNQIRVSLKSIVIQLNLNFLRGVIAISSLKAKN